MTATPRLDRPYFTLAIGFLMLAVLMHWGWVFAGLLMLAGAIGDAKGQPRRRRWLLALFAVVVVGMVVAGCYTLGKTLALRDNAMAAADCRADCGGGGRTIP